MKANKKKHSPKPGKDRARKQEFPGYPPYDPKEDITKQGKRVEGNLGDAGIAGNTEKDQRKVPRGGQKGESEVGKEDLEALGPKDLSMDMGEDEALKHRRRPVDFAGSDLDVPGSELDDADEEIGSEDEENNSYSLGGDSKENLEERKD